MSTMSDHPKVTSEVTESVPSNATTLSSTSVPHESVVESSESVHTESTEGGPSEVTTKPTVASSLTSDSPDQKLITKAGDDAIHLNRAFAGWGCDEATIMNILAQAKTETHRTLIRQEYKNKFSEDFDNRLSKQLMLSADLKVQR